MQKLSQRQQRKIRMLSYTFRLKNVPCIFQRTLDDIPREHIGKCCHVNIDDTIIFSKNETEQYNSDIRNADFHRSLNLRSKQISIK